jgi:hypothetical protein
MAYFLVYIREPTEQYGCVIELESGSGGNAADAKVSPALAGKQENASGALSDHPIASNPKREQT